MRWKPSASARNQCQKCGSHVTGEFRRGYGDQDDVAHRCPTCDTYERLSDGSASGQFVALPDPLDDPTRFNCSRADLPERILTLVESRAATTDGGEDDDHKIRTDGGHCTDGTGREKVGYSRRENEVVSQFEHEPVQRRGRNSLDPQEQELTPIGRIRPSEISFAAYADLHSVQTATSRLWSPIASTSSIRRASNNFNPYFKHRVTHRSVTVFFNRSLCTDSGQDGDSR
ncbi:DUF7563 family protein [Natrarchaeobius chitinivorans]